MEPTSFQRGPLRSFPSSSLMSSLITISPAHLRKRCDIPTQKGDAEVLAEYGVEDEALEPTREQLGVPDTEAAQQPRAFLLSSGTEAER